MRRLTGEGICRVSVVRVFAQELQEEVRSGISDDSHPNSGLQSLGL